MEFHLLYDHHFHALAAYAGKLMENRAAGEDIAQEARKLLATVGAQINTGTLLDVPQDANIIMANGKYELRTDTCVPENSVLIANGHTRLHPGAQNNLSSFIKIIVNGHLIAPESMRSQMGNMTINGTETFYPDEAEYVEGKLQLNRRFCRFVQENSVYFATGAAILMEKNVDVEELLSKNVIIHAKKAYIASEYPDGELFFSPKTQIESVPEGYTFIQGNLTIDESTAWSQGTKLFVVGNVTADAEAADGLKALEEIIVHGTAKVHEDLMELWQERCKQAAKVKVIDKSRKIEDMDSPVIISRELLEMCESGLRIANCNIVEILPDVEFDLIRELLRGFAPSPHQGRSSLDPSSGHAIHNFKQRAGEAPGNGDAHGHGGRMPPAGCIASGENRKKGGRESSLSPPPFFMFSLCPCKSLFRSQSCLRIQAA